MYVYMGQNRTNGKCHFIIPPLLTCTLGMTLERLVISV